MKSTFFDLIPWIIGILLVYTLVDNLIKKSQLRREYLVSVWLSKKLDLDKWLMDDPTRSTLSPEGQWYLREAVDAIAALIRYDGKDADPEDRNVYAHLCSRVSHNIVPRGPFSIPSTSD